MTTTMRRRVYVLQVGLIGILVFCAGFLFWGNSFIHNQISTELTNQQIFFPAAGTPGLPAIEMADLQQYGGKQVVNGDMAKAYANGFIGRHLTNVAGGLTYSQVSAKAQANPTNVKLAGQVQSLFRGETLRGLLLNAYGWWTIGTYALYAAIGLALAAFAVFGALLFEVFLVVRESRKVRVPAFATRPQPVTA
ncbi:MAG TPA: hypothetical protein VGD57_09105 [Candidatus Dormibacteraeota bacterium]